MHYKCCFTRTIQKYGGGGKKSYWIWKQYYSGAGKFLIFLLKMEIMHVNTGTSLQCLKKYKLINKQTTRAFGTSVNTQTNSIINTVYVA